MNATMQQIAERIKRAKSVLIMTHMRPDGDALGSALALFSALKKLNIRGQVCVESDIPSNLRFIKGVETIAKKPAGSYDLLVTVDCSDEQRLGLLQTEFGKAKRAKIDTVNIDHHISNTRFAKYDFVQECAANCMHIATLIEYLGVPFDKTIAEYLLIGLLTDSGNFSHDDVTEETFLLAAKLTKAGADVGKLNTELFKNQPKQRAKFYAETMSKMRYALEDKFAFIVLTYDQMKERGIDLGMTEGFVDFPLSVSGVEVGASLLEIKKGQYKISLRSKNYADVNGVAATFGGGGHVRAAGCMLFGDLEDVIDRLTYAVYQHI